MGSERRRHKRVRCAIPCEVRGRGQSVAGTARDVSVGGLSVQADLQVDQGDVVHLVLHPPRRRDIPVQAIVWHQRRVRQRGSGKISARLGLVLSEAPDDFQELLGLPEAPAASPGRAPQQSDTKPRIAMPPPLPSRRRATRSPEPPSKPPAPGLPRPERYRVRVKRDDAPRSRSILVFAEGEDDARRSALAETGRGWSILDVERA